MTPEELETLLTRVIESQNQIHWISFAPPAIWIIALIVAIFQLTRLVRQTKDDHERSRRERTVEIMKYYQEGTKPEHNKIIQLLDRIPEDDLINLRDGKPITLKGELKEVACSILSTRFDGVYDRYCGNNDERKAELDQLSHAEAMTIRFCMLDILNHYETCLIPWHLGIVDRGTIEEQFRPLVDIRDGKHKLQAARDVFGVDKFPATEAFKKHLFEIKSNNSKAKPPLAETKK